MYPHWLTVAKNYIGLREVPGPKHNSVIVGWLDSLGAWWKGDEEPWCGVFCAHVMKESGFSYPGMYMRAKSWLSWGTKLRNPVLGCIAVFGRSGGGHVGFVVGMTADGKHLAILGGNQSNMVNVMLISRSRLLDYRLPPGYNYSLTAAVPVASAETLLKSSNEA